MKKTLFVSLGALSAVHLILACCPASDRVDFNRDVRPILSNTCFKCHGPDEDHRQADLRLDTAEGATADFGGYRAIEPGDPGASEAIARITTDDVDMLMPPVDSGLKLTTEQMELLRGWVQQGAAYEQHWAFTPIVRPMPPSVDQTAWPQNSIDHFILARLEAAGIKPAPQADRQTLVRRLHLDLLGLPPTPEEVGAFAADQSADAYMKMVDRVLASPHYGERWGRYWLDQARYADTNGYTIDSERSIWPFRDWVIAALNRDLPFDRFTIEQLAGDLLPEPTQGQRVATGFHRNTLVNQEGGSDREQFRNEAVVDRVNTTGSVWLGLTIGCAQCHHHKYDPISQRDYYQLFAFFNSSQDANSTTPTIRVAAAEAQQRLADFDRQIAAAQADLDRYDQEKSRRLPAGQRDDGQPVAWTLLDADEVQSQAGATFEFLEDESIVVGGDNADAEQYTVTATSPLPQVTAARLEVLTHPSLPKGGPGRAGNGNFVLNEIRITGADGREQPWLHATADHSQKDYDVTAAIDGDPATGWAINVTKGQMNVNRTAQFMLTDPMPRSASDRLTIVFQFGDKPAKYNIGRFRLAVTDAPPAKLGLPDPDRARLAAVLKGLEDRKKRDASAIPTTMVMAELDAPRATHVLIRGDFLRPGDPVAADAPAVLPPLPPTDGHRTRLDLARWLVDGRNPLTGRVAVNRVWMRYFGRGIVETEDDFGIQGTPPTHPQLLDWLATEFMASGWSMKHLHRLIVTSAVYRQSSHARPDLETIDPLNKLLARQSRLRVDAETVRDLGLAVSGLLSRKIGGPSVYPPQPDGVYAFTQRRASWPTSTGADRYRRGMYTFFMRSAPYPMLTTFDAPKFNKTCTRRDRSNTPLQSLTMANDQTMLEMARALGRRLLTGLPAGEHDRISHAFQLCFSRLPDTAESERLEDYLARQRTAFTENPDDADGLASDGFPEDVPSAEAAAWVALARVLINLDEFITRE